MRKLHLIAVFVAMLLMMLPVCFADELNFVYDANGNVVDKGDGFIRHYNSLNQLERVTNKTDGSLVQEFVHDPVEERIVIKKDYLKK